MVKAIGDLFTCEGCGSFYRDMDVAQRCEAFCIAYNACDTQILKDSVMPR